MVADGETHQSFPRTGGPAVVPLGVRDLDQAVVFGVLPTPSLDKMSSDRSLTRRPNRELPAVWARDGDGEAPGGPGVTTRSRSVISPWRQPFPLRKGAGSAVNSAFPRPAEDFL